MANKKGGATKSRTKSDKGNGRATLAVKRAISAATINRLADDVIGLQTRANAAGGEVGAVIRGAVEKGLNPVAFRMALRLRKKGINDPVALRVTLDDFDYYREALGLDALKAAMIDDGRDHADAGDGDTATMSVAEDGEANGGRIGFLAASHPSPSEFIGHTVLEV